MTNGRDSTKSSAGPRTLAAVVILAPILLTAVWGGAAFAACTDTYNACVDQCAVAHYRYGACAFKCGFKLTCDAGYDFGKCEDKCYQKCQTTQAKLFKKGCVCNTADPLQICGY